MLFPETPVGFGAAAQAAQDDQVLDLNRELDHNAKHRLEAQRHLKVHHDLSHHRVAAQHRLDFLCDNECNAVNEDVEELDLEAPVNLYRISTLENVHARKYADIKCMLLEGDATDIKRLLLRRHNCISACC